MKPFTSKSVLVGHLFSVRYTADSAAIRGVKLMWT